MIPLRRILNTLVVKDGDTIKIVWNNRKQPEYTASLILSGIYVCVTTYAIVTLVELNTLMTPNFGNTKFS